MPRTRDAKPDLDIASQLARAAEQIGQLQRELEHADRLATLGTLAAGIAHEINNVLTPVLAYAQLALSRPDDADLHTKAMTRAVQGVELATKITQAMLGFAGPPIQGNQANVADVFQAALDCIGRDPVKDRIRLDIRIPADLEVSMRPVALQQVFVNLILNARSAMQSKGGEIAINATRQDRVACIQLSDNGPGIPQEIQAQIFEPFGAARIRSKLGENGKRQGGSGLGLSICRMLVEEAGGSIACQSQLGKGTTFQLIAPVAVRTV